MRKLLTGIIACALLGVPGILRAADNPTAVQITSPLGRSGLPGRVRIVARVTNAPDATYPAVRFYVNDVLLGTDSDGPPYAIEWDDENPFEKSRLAVEVDGEEGRVVRDEVELKAFEFLEVTRVLSVGLEASVVDGRGRFVGGLKEDDFEIREDGEPQKLDSLSSDAIPATFALLVDSSQSMSRNIDFVRAAAGQITKYLRNVDSVVVAPFRKGIVNVTGPTRDAATIADAVSTIKAQGTTAILESLDEVAGRFAEGPGRRVVVLVTDGYDERSEVDADEVVKRLKESRVTVYVVSIGGVAGVSNRGERLLKRIAQETGGRAFFPWNERQLTEAHTAIAEDVQHQYRLAYTPVNQNEDGTWRTIAVATKNPDLHVRAREGYRAPLPPPVRASVEFTVTNDRQQYVDLTRDDLEVTEDGVPQEVDVFNEAVAPVSIMMALDTSGSMTRVAPAVQEAAHTFVSALKKDDPLGLVMFADKAESVHDLSTRRELAHEGIQGYVAKGGTALYDGLGEAAARLRSVEGRRVIVVMTDGRDENAASNGPGSERSWESVIAAVTDAQATVYAIGLGTNVDRARLEQLAHVTGGEAYFTTDVTELQQQFHRIVEELHRRYVLAYTSTNPKRDGKWRTVEIRVREDDLKVRSRGGYFAPEK